MKMNTLVLACSLISASSASFATIDACPELVETKDAFWTMDVLIPNALFNNALSNAGFHTYSKAERACKQVTVACSYSGLKFNVPTTQDWKNLLSQNMFDRLYHPYGLEGRGYWASEKSHGWGAIGPIPAWVEQRQLLVFPEHTFMSMDADALMATKCISRK
jgi:hypothetical protein